MDRKQRHRKIIGPLHIVLDLTDAEQKYISLRTRNRYSGNHTDSAHATRKTHQLRLWLPSKRQNINITRILKKT